MSKTLRITFTHTHDKRPLVTLDGYVFNGVDIRPDDLLSLAQELTIAAQTAKLRDPTKRQYSRPETIEVVL